MKKTAKNNKTKVENVNENRTKVASNIPTKTPKKTQVKNIYEDKGRGVKVTVKSDSDLKEEDLYIVLNTTKGLLKNAKPSFWQRLKFWK